MAKKLMSVKLGHNYTPSMRRLQIERIEQFIADALVFTVIYPTNNITNAIYSVSLEPSLGPGMVDTQSK